MNDLDQLILGYGPSYKIHNYKGWEDTSQRSPLIRELQLGPDGILHIIFMVYKFNKTPIKCGKKNFHPLDMVTHIFNNYYTGVQSYYLHEQLKSKGQHISQFITINLED
jgi:hypothetical protein